MLVGEGNTQLDQIEHVDIALNEDVRIAAASLLTGQVTPWELSIHRYYRIFLH